MGILLQLGLGLLPGAVGALAFLVRRRAFGVRQIVTVLLLFGLSGGMITAGVLQLPGQEKPHRQASKRELLAFANALYLEGDRESAEEVLEVYSRAYGYDNQCRLLTARIFLAEGSYDRAAGLYACLEDEEDLSVSAREVQYARGKASHSEAALAMLRYLQDMGENPGDYGYAEDSYRTLSAAADMDLSLVLRDIRIEVEDAYDLEEGAIRDCAALLADMKDQEAGVWEEEQARRCRRVFSGLEEEAAGLLELSCVRRARLEIYVRDGDFDKVTKNLGETSTYHELMLAAELYMGGMVEASDFPESFQSVDSDAAREVKRQLKAVLNANRKGTSVQERKAMKARVAALETQLGAPELAVLKSRLQEQAAEAGEDSSKVYLELARVETYFGNETAADTCLGNAVYASQNCGDDNYAYAMGQIAGVIEGKGDLEDIKCVPDYVDTVMRNALTVDVEEILAVNTAANMAEQAAEEEAADADGRQDAGRETEEEDSAAVGGMAGYHGFPQTVADYVSRARSAISIGSIDTEQFERISAKVQISSDYINDTKELKNALQVYDCGAQITEFSLEKIEYAGSNILLCCDVSGSMSDSMGDLKDAVKTFIRDRNQDEQLAVVTFHSEIAASGGFGATDEEILALAEDMRAGGGTDMFSAVMNCLGGFPGGRGENNVLILMTDGQDGGMHSSQEIEEQIGGLAREKGVTIYTIGLGTSVDTEYLTTIADSGSGSFVYVSASDSLNSFYDMLHEQLYNRYRLTYQAQDTMTMRGRTLEVALPEENVRASRTYHLTEDGDAGGALSITRGISVSGMSPRYLYKGLQDVRVELRGTGFRKESTVSVKLHGTLDYTISAEYVSEEAYALTIPAEVAVGSYNVEVSIDGQRTVLQNGFSVITRGNEKTTAFGKYVFTSGEKIENADGSWLLRDGVQMNGWLRFKGDVRLTGDIENGGSIRVTENDGSYVEFHTATAEGLGALLARKGVSLDIPALYSFTLYRDGEMVDDIQTGALAVFQVLRFDSPSVQLHPDSIRLNYKTGSTILPYQENILKACGAKELFQFSVDGTAQITDRNVGLILDASYKDADSQNYNRTLNLFNAPVYFNGSVKVKLDTIKNEYTLGAMVHLAFFAEQSGIGAEISWKGLTVDAVKLEAKLAEGIKLPTTIPITANDFGFQVSDIQQALESGRFTSLVFEGSVSLSSEKLSHYFPKLKDFVGDITVLAMPDTTASFRISPFRVEAGATLVFLDEITLAEAGLKLGGFEYTNEMLDLEDEEVQGVNASLKLGLLWDSADGRVKVDVSGRGELDAHSRFVGVCLNGTAKVDVKWWLFNFESKKEGDICLGLYTTHAGKQEFVLVTKYEESGGKIKGNFYYIDENGYAGEDKGYLCR
ncbi:MAG: VWA domain-containing protein [Butyrivibrio sp.]|nr:VWA domain-containing protein [Acetatifactor muris]MCM1560421.1 VWA domain-containing protein [Butyrivibrio sp.]